MDEARPTGARSRRAEPGRRGAWIALVVLLAAGLLGGALQAGPTIALLCGCLLVCLAGLPLLLRLRADILDAPGVYGFMTVITFAVTALAWLGSPGQPGPGLGRSDVALALVVVASALASFAFGAYWFRVGPRRLASREPTPGAPVRVFVAIFAVAMAVTVVAIAVGAYGYLGTDAKASRLGGIGPAVPFVAQLTRIALLCLAIEWLRSGRRQLGVLLAGLLALQLLVGFLAGMKSESLYPVVLIGLAFIAHRRTVPGRLLLGAALFAVFILLPASQAFRTAARGKEPATVARVAEAVAKGVAVRPDRSLADAGTYFAGRFRNIDNVALIARDTPDVYAWGDPTLYLLTPVLIVVPRAVWPGKPVLNAGGQFARTYWETPPAIRTAQPLTQIGDLYRTFGPAGPVLAMFFLGLLAAWWSSWSRRRVSPRAEAVYLYTIAVIVASVESDLPNLIVTSAKALPLVALVSWYLLPGAGEPPGYGRVGRGARRTWTGVAQRFGLGQARQGHDAGGSVLAPAGRLPNDGPS